MKAWQNQYDYGERVYDPRIGKFLSVDPLFKDFPTLTPYQYASNTPASSIDIDGLESSKKYNVVDWLVEFGKGFWEGISGDNYDATPATSNVSSIILLPQFYKRDIGHQIHEKVNATAHRINKEGPINFAKAKLKEVGVNTVAGLQDLGEKIGEGDPSTIGVVTGTAVSLSTPLLNQEIQGSMRQRKRIRRKRKWWSSS